MMPTAAPWDRRGAARIVLIPVARCRAASSGYWARTTAFRSWTWMTRRSSAARPWTLPGLSGNGLSKLPRRAQRPVLGDEAQGRALDKDNLGVATVAEAGRRLGDGVQHWLQRGQ